MDEKEEVSVGKGDDSMLVSKDLVLASNGLNCLKYLCGLIKGLYYTLVIFCFLRFMLLSSEQRKSCEMVHANKFLNKGVRICGLINTQLETFFVGEIMVLWTICVVKLFSIERIQYQLQTLCVRECISQLCKESSIHSYEHVWK